MAGLATKPAPAAVTPQRERDARARLSAALKPDPNLRRIGADSRILYGFVPLLLLPFAGAALMALHVPRIPAIGEDWRAWIEPGGFAVAGLCVAGAFFWLMQRVITRWNASRPDSPEAAIFEFYRAAQRNPSRLAAVTCLYGKPETPRPVFSWMTAAAAPVIDSPKAMIKYWNILLRGNPAVARRVKLRALAITHPRGDVAVARAALRVRAIRRVRARAALIPAFALAVTPFAIGSDRIVTVGAPFWPVALAAIALALCVWWLVRWLGGAVAETRDVVLTKVIVRASYNWRMLCPEWEADAETDLAWLSMK